MTPPAPHPDYAGLVEALQAQYASIPPGEPVRLAKQTSNLFRTRAADTDTVPRLDVSGYDAAQKLSVVAMLAFDSSIGTDQFLIEGIRGIEDIDFRFADRFGESYRAYCRHVPRVIPRLTAWRGPEP